MNIYYYLIDLWPFLILLSAVAISDLIRKFLKKSSSIAGKEQL